MQRNQSPAKWWRSAKIHGLAAICLLSCAGIAYWARAPFRAGSTTPQAERPVVAHASDARIAPDLPANRQAEPLLARLQKSPEDPILLAEIGKLYYQMGQYHTAAKYYEDSVRVKPDAVILVKLGGAYHFDGDEERALGAWNDALRLDPANPDALFNIGLVKWRAQGDRKGAIAAWEKLLETNPNHPKRAQVEELLTRAKQHPDTPVGNQERPAR
jgi:cytochrome c-type biogenesis protein CcmH/NrfG